MPFVAARSRVQPTIVAKANLSPLVDAFKADQLRTDLPKVGNEPNVHRRGTSQHQLEVPAILWAQSQQGPPPFQTISIANSASYQRQGRIYWAEACAAGSGGIGCTTSLSSTAQCSTRVAVSLLLGLQHQLRNRQVSDAYQFHIYGLNAVHESALQQAVVRQPVVAQPNAAVARNKAGSQQSQKMAKHAFFS